MIVVADHRVAGQIVHAEHPLGASNVSALYHTGIAGGGNQRGNFQRGVQNRGDGCPVRAGGCDKPHGFASGGNGHHTLLDAGVCAFVYGKGAFPVVGIPGNDVGGNQIVVLVLTRQLQQFPEPLIFPLISVGGSGVVLHGGDFCFQFLVFRL